MRRTVIGLFKSFHQAEKAVSEIEAEGYANNQISLVVKKTETSSFDSGAEFKGEFTANSASGLVVNLDSTLVKEDHIELPVIGMVNAGGPLAGEVANTISSYGAHGVEKWSKSIGKPLKPWN